MTDIYKFPGHARRLKKYESFRILDDIRIRYYGKLRLAKSPGRSVGNRVVTELNLITNVDGNPGYPGTSDRHSSQIRRQAPLCHGPGDRKIHRGDILNHGNITDR